MNDPHVEWLRYKIVADSVVYRDPHPVVGGTPDFRSTLEDGQAFIEMIGHCATIGDALAVVDPYLHTWEIHAGATFKGTAEPLRFRFESIHIIDRSPSAGDERSAQTFGMSAMEFPAVSVSTDVYPCAPAGFAVSPDVETLWTRWQGYLAGREPLAAMAYFCFTVYVNNGSLAAAAGRYGFSKPVLKKLSELTSTVGDVGTARKADVRHPRPYTGEEIRWIEDVVKAMIRRAGEWAFDPNQTFDTLTMTSFPPI